MVFQQIETLLNGIFFKDSSVQIIKESVLEYFIIFIHQIIKSLFPPHRIFCPGNYSADHLVQCLYLIDRGLEAQRIQVGCCFSV